MLKQTFAIRKPMEKPKQDSKGFSLPGFPNATLASVHCLMFAYDWKEKDIQWLEKNWIKLDYMENGYPVYAKPGASYDDPLYSKKDKEITS